MNLIIIATLPIAIIIVSHLVFGLTGWLKGTFRETIKTTNMACIIVAFFLIHPNIIKQVFTSFSCTEIDNSLYLEIDMSEECWTGDHLIYTLSVSIPALILWGIGVPAFAIFKLRGKYVRRRLDSVRNKSIYGFLYNGYKFSSYYWEVIILYRKVLITFILVFFGLISI